MINPPHWSDLALGLIYALAAMKLEEYMPVWIAWTIMISVGLCLHFGTPVFGGKP